MNDYVVDKKVVITASGVEAVRMLAVEGILPYVKQLEWQRDGAEIHVEDTGDYAAIEISRSLFQDIDRQGAWLPSLSEAFGKADSQLSTADAARTWWDKCVEGFAMLPSFPSLSTSAGVPFALATGRADVEGHPGVYLRVERYVP